MRPGPASVTLVLEKMENTLKKGLTQRKDGFKTHWSHSDFSLYASFIQENAAILGKTTAPVSLQEIPVTVAEIDDRDGSRFLNILSRVSNGHEGVSRQERLFVHHFWAEIQNTFYKIRSA
jgi:hypothetical protein